MPLPTPVIDPHGLQDPLSEKFWQDTWVSLAVHNVSLSGAPGSRARADQAPGC